MIDCVDIWCFCQSCRGSPLAFRTTTFVDCTSRFASQAPLTANS